jgi:hypothetical protein
MQNQEGFYVRGGASTLYLTKGEILLAFGMLLVREMHAAPPGPTESDVALSLAKDAGRAAMEEWKSRHETHRGRPSEDCPFCTDEEDARG